MDGQASPDVAATQAGEAVETAHDGPSVEPVENVEGVQEAHAVQVPQAPVNGQHNPPRFCPRCHRLATWRIRDGHFVCHHCSAQVWGH
jgi:ribosomal protein L37AE/L43A